MRQGPRREVVGQAERIKRLSMVDILEPLSTEEIALLSQRTPDRSFDKGEMVYSARDASDVLFLLVRGRIRLYDVVVGGQEFTFDVIGAGTIFGESSLAGRAHPEYAQALEPALVLLLKVTTFWQLVRQNPEMNKRVVKLLVTRSSMNRSRMTDIAVKEVPTRLAGLILDLVQSDGLVTREGYYKVASHYTHEHLASMIGATRGSVTRAFGTLQDSESVLLLRRHIYVTDLGTLKRLAVEG
jgi:CRP/FNR family transcriptional regulator, cyclic AMP receptor protein